jgi:hypothetical protein
MLLPRLRAELAGSCLILVVEATCLPLPGDGGLRGRAVTCLHNLKEANLIIFFDWLKTEDYVRVLEER